MAAKHHMAVAEIYETEHVDIDQVQIMICEKKRENECLVNSALLTMNRQLTITEERSQTGILYYCVPD